MAFNGSGVFVRLYNWVTDKANGIKVRADRMDAEMDGMATGLSTCITKDGQTQPTQNLPMNSKKHTSVANASARTEYAAAGQVQDGALVWGGTAGGTVDAITITTTPATTAHTTGQAFLFLSSGANTGAVTLNPNGISAKAITKNGTTALVAGDIPANAIVKVVYDGTQYQLIVANAVLLFGAQTVAGNKTFTGVTALSGGGTVTPQATPATTEIGYLGAPPNTQNAAYTLAMTDVGLTIYHDETTARTWTIPANASVPFPNGTTIVLDNTGNSGGTPGAITLVITTDTLRRGDGVAGTGSRTIPANSVATIRKNKATEWAITGSFT